MNLIWDTLRKSVWLEALWKSCIKAQTIHRKCNSSTISATYRKKFHFCLTHSFCH